jgi:hypothetical protein
MIPVFRQSRETKWTSIVSERHNFSKMMPNVANFLLETSLLPQLIETQQSAYGIHMHLAPAVWAERPNQRAFYISLPENHYHVRRIARFQKNTLSE